MNEIQTAVRNRAPLRPTPFAELPLGSIKPAGWLRDQLEIQASGLTGKLHEHWDDVGPGSGWLGGDGESWERGPYYLDGLLPLAYLLEDDELIARTKPWIEWTLASQREDGQFGPEVNDDWWPRMIMAKVLIQYAEATGDERVVPFLTKYFRYQAAHIESKPLSDWGQARGGENLLCIQWLYNRTGDAFLLNLAETIHRQTLEWTDIFTHFPFWRYQTRFNHRTHVVNVAMGIKEPAVYYLHSGEDAHRDAAMKGIQSLMTYHGQVHGLWSGDEWLAGTHPSQGVELCAVVEYMFSLETLIRILGDGVYGDILEKVAFNALPAAITPDWHGHQYDQQVNQVLCTRARRNWTQNGDDSNMFGLEPHFGCCTANMHQGWPKYAARLWMATEDDGIAAVSYAPCRVDAVVAGGTKAHIVVETEYPFRETVSITVKLAKNASFPIKLRIPGWCDAPAIRINGQIQAAAPRGGFVTIRRQWSDGDRIELTLPMQVRLERRAERAVGVQRGPLVYALPVGERWVKRRGSAPFPDWEVYPTTPWNYGLLLDAQNPDASFQVETGPVVRQPFVAKDAPVKLAGKGRRIPEWGLEMNSAGTPPHSPVSSSEPLEDIKLVPYGSARLRIAEFPVVKE